MTTKLPPFGLCMPCRICRVVDGDTIVIGLQHSGRQYPIRLLDCWAAERNTTAGQTATVAANRIIERGKSYAVFVPLPEGCDSPLDLLSLNRVLGRVFVDGKDLGETLVRNGYASATKPKPDRARKDDE